MSPGSGGQVPRRRPPGAPGRGKSFALALVVHGLLVALLFVGVRWQTQTPPPVQAELWAPAPPAAPPVEVRPEPRPERRPEPPPAPTRPEPQPEVRKPDIALEKAREERERRQREEEQARQDRQRREAEARKEAERKEAESRKLAEAKAKKEAEARREKEAEARKEAERKEAEARKVAEAKARKEAEDEARRREDHLQKMIAQAGGRPDGKASENRAGAAAGADAGAASGSLDADYGARLAARIRLATTYAVPPELAGNPQAEFNVSLMPDCTVMAARLARSSGVTSWDQAAQRGIMAASPFPRPRNGTCPREMLIAQRPREEPR